MAYKDPDAHRGEIQLNQRRHRLKQYGLTLETFAEMLAGQEGLCALCGGPPCDGWDILHVDHCHETGRVRGLLCHRCNTGIGKFNDDPELLRKAATYVT